MKEKEKERITGKEAAHVAEDMASRGPVRLVASNDIQEAQAAALPSADSEQRGTPPRVRKPSPQNDQCLAPTSDLEGHRKRLRQAFGTMSDEFVDVILGKLIEALRPGLYDKLEEGNFQCRSGYDRFHAPADGVAGAFGSPDHCHGPLRASVSSAKPPAHD
jgi:hypothetical protein